MGVTVSAIDTRRRWSAGRGQGVPDEPPLLPGCWPASCGCAWDDDCGWSAVVWADELADVELLGLPELLDDVLLGGVLLADEELAGTDSTGLIALTEPVGVVAGGVPPVASNRASNDWRCWDRSAFPSSLDTEGREDWASARAVCASRKRPCCNASLAWPSSVRTA